MNTKKRSKKAIVLSLGLVAGLLLAHGAFAQNPPTANGGLFGKGKSSDAPDSRGLLNGSGSYYLHNQGFGSGGENGTVLTNEYFGQNVPVGSGLLVMTIAGAAYALGKRKKSNPKTKQS